MGRKKFDAPQWFKDAFASYRAMRAKGDVSSSEMYELLADDVQDRHKAGDPFGRSVWVDFIIGHDGSVKRTQAEADAEAQALAQASGYLQPDLFPREVLDRLGLPLVVDLGFNKKVMTPDLDWDGFEKAIKEVERKEKSWEKSLTEQKDALLRGQALVPRDNSKTLRQAVSDPEEYGHGAGAQ